MTASPRLRCTTGTNAASGWTAPTPQVERWLRDLFREVTDSWGYDYVKIDFLYGAAIAGRRHDASATRVDSYRRGLAAVRAGVGDTRFVLGCGALMGASVGIIDGQRIGPDVAPWWRFRRKGMSPMRAAGRVSRASRRRRTRCATS